MLESRAQIPHEEFVVLVGKDVASWQCDGDLSRGQGHLVPGEGGHWQEIFVGVKPPSSVQPPVDIQCYLFLRFFVSEMKNSVCVRVCVCVCARAHEQGCPQLSSVAHNLCPDPGAALTVRTHILSSAALGADAFGPQFAV